MGVYFFKPSLAGAGLFRNCNLAQSNGSPHLALRVVSSPSSMFLPEWWGLLERLLTDLALYHFPDALITYLLGNTRFIYISPH